jgi:hypothetical protein
MQVQTRPAITSIRPLPTVTFNSSVQSAPVAAVLAPQDQLSVQRLQGAIPAQLGLFASFPQVDQALAQLKANPSEAHFKASQAQYRVSLRGLSIVQLESVVRQLEQEINRNSDYRTQVFLDQAIVDTRMEIFYKGGKPNFPQPGMPPLPGNEPGSIVENTLKQLKQHGSEANFRTAQAGFRVAIRDLNVEQLQQSIALLNRQVESEGDYRTQKLLNGLLLDARLEIARKGGKPDFAEPAMPPSVGREPSEIVNNALKLLQNKPSEANFQLASASFRVALRSLNPAQLKDTEKYVMAAIGGTSDYRTQKFLDGLLVDLKLANLNFQKP